MVRMKIMITQRTKSIPLAVLVIFVSIVFSGSHNYTLLGIFVLIFFVGLILFLKVIKLK